MNNPIQRSSNMMSGPGGRPPMMPPQGPRPVPMPPPGGQMAMTPKEILGILRRHILMIAVLTVTGLMIGGVSWFLCDRYLPKYTSIRPIDVDPPIQTDVTQITTIQPQKDIYYQFRFTKASLIKQDHMLEELLNQSPKVRDTQWFKRFAQVDEQGNITGDRAKAIDAAFKDLQDNLGASAPRDYNYVIVSMTCGSSGDAQTIVNEMVRIFLSQQQELARSGLKDELAQFRAQREQIQTKLNQIEASLETIRGGTDFARLNLGKQQGFRDYMDERLADLEAQNTSLENDRSRLETVIAQLKAKAEAFEFDETVQEQIENDPIARQMRSSIASMEPLLDRQLARFGEDHRLVQETQAALKQMRDQLAERQYEIGEIIRQSNLLGANESMAALTSQLETAMRQLQAARKEYKDIDRIRTLYASYEDQRQENLDRLQEMNTLIEKKNAQHNDPRLSKLASPYTATKPRVKSFPNKMIFLPGGLMLGLLLGLGLAFLVELVNDTLRSPSDVMRHIKAPLMGMICHVDDDDDVQDADLYHVVRQSPYSIMSECYRQLRTNLKLAGPEVSQRKAIYITSSDAGDGKTTVAVNLVSTLLAEDRRVLLIDANFRRPSTGRLFPRTKMNGSAGFPDYGLSNYLMGQCDRQQLVRDSGIAGLSVVDSGPLPPNPAELFTQERMKNLIEHCKADFEYIIIDGPAMLVSDSKTLASQADGTIVVINASATHRGTAARILRELKDIDANVIGTVLMGVKSRKGGYFREIYRSYQEYQRVHVEQPA